MLSSRILRRDGGSVMALPRGDECAAGAEASMADVRESGGSAAAGWPAASGRPAESRRHNSAAAPFPWVPPAFGETAVPAGTGASSRPRLERRTPAGAREERGSAGAAGRARGAGDGGAGAPALARPPGREAAAARLGLRLSGPELSSLLAAPSSQERSIASHRIAAAAPAPPGRPAAHTASLLLSVRTQPRRRPSGSPCTAAPPPRTPTAERMGCGRRRGGPRAP